MKLLRFLLLVPISVWMQVSFLGVWRPLGVVPNLLLIVVLAAATSAAHASEVLAISVIGGFLLDVSSGTDFGLRITYFCVLALLLIMIRRTGAEVERLGMKVAVVASATILYDAVVLIPLFGSQSAVAWDGVIAKIATELIVNIIFMLILNWPLQGLLNMNKLAAKPIVSQE
jgi:cell shape-determining protein MreD